MDLGDSVKLYNTFASKIEEQRNEIKQKKQDKKDKFSLHQDLIAKIDELNAIVEAAE